MKLRSVPRKTVFFLVIAVLVGALAAAFAVNQDLTPDFAAQSDTVDIFNFTYNHSDTSGLHNITRFEFNYTGDSTADIANVTVFTDQHGLYGFNATPGAWQEGSGGGFLFNITNKSNTVDNFPQDLANFTLNVTLASDAANNSVVDLELVDNDTTNIKFWGGKLPFNPDGNTTVDAFAPRVNTIHSPTDDNNVTDTITLNATIVDGGSGIDLVFFNVTNSTGHEINYSNAENLDADFWNVSLDTVKFLEDGEHNITVDANDTVSNVNDTEFHTISVDNQAPRITTVNPVRFQNVSGLVNVTGTTTELGTVTTLFQYRWINNTGDNATTWTDLNDTDFDTSALDDGLYNLTFNATDYTGNINDSDVNISNVHIDNTAPNGTDDLALFTRNQSNAETSDAATNILRGRGIGFNWTNYTATVEITDHNDSTGFTGVNELELWARNKTFNRSTQDFGDAWTAWWVVNDSIDAATAAFNNTTAGLSTGKQYEFNLSTVDFANNTADSNIINATLDGKGPELSLDSGLENVTTPFNWTNQSSLTFTFNITDLAGVFNHTSDRNGNGVNVTFWNDTSAGASKHFRNVSLTPLSNRSVQYNVTDDNPVANLENLSFFNVTVRATDILGQTTDFNWSFQTDFNEPNSVNATEFTDPLFNNWFKDEHTIQVTCSEPAGESLPKEAALETGGANNAGWDRLNNVTGGTPSRNLTATQHGNHTYTVKCRDFAGNVNNTVNVTDIAIDANTPEVVGDNTSNSMSTSPTINIDINDEGNESWLNSTNSSLSLHGGSGSIDTRDWGNNSIVVKLTSLENSQDYRIEGNLSDNVGHHYLIGSNDINFETQSSSSSNNNNNNGGGGGGGGGGESSDSLTIASAPSDASLAPGGTEDLVVDVENDGDTNLTDIAVVANVSAPVQVDGTSPDVFDLDSGNTETVTVTLSAWENASDQDMDITLTAQDGAEDSVTVTVSISTYTVADLALENMPGSIELPRNGNTSFTGTVANNGNRTADVNLTATTGEDTLNLSITPVQVSLSADASENASVTVAAEETPVDVYTATMTAETGDDTVSGDVSIKVQPDSNETEQRIEASAQELGDEYEALQEQVNMLDGTNATRDANETLQAANRLLQQINAALADGDYATAKALQEQLRERLSTAEQDVAAAEEAGTGLSWVWWTVIIITVLAALSVIAYFILAETGAGEPGQEGYQGFQSGGSGSGGVMEGLKKSMQHIASAVTSLFNKGEGEALSPEERRAKQELVEKYNVQIEE